MTREGLTRRLVRAVAHLPPALRTSGQIAREGRFQGAIQKQAELAPFIAYVRQLRPSVVLEVGTASGGTLYSLCQVAAEDALVVSVDIPWEGFGERWNDEHLDRIRSFGRKHQRLVFVQRDSHSDEALAEVRAALDGRMVDVLFIDADHTYDGVLQDYEMYAPLVRSGGAVAFHDIAPNPDDADCEVDRVWDEIKQGRTHLELIAPGDALGGIGVLVP